jgi:hypothetical protein
LLREGVADEPTAEGWPKEDAAIPFLDFGMAGLVAGACLRLIVCFAASRNWAAVVVKAADDASAISSLYFYRSALVYVLKSSTIRTTVVQLGYGLRLWSDASKLTVLRLN